MVYDPGFIITFTFVGSVLYIHGFLELSRLVQRLSVVFVSIKGSVNLGIELQVVVCCVSECLEHSCLLVVIVKLVSALANNASNGCVYRLQIYAGKSMDYRAVL